MKTNRSAIDPHFMLRLLECTSSSLYAIMKENCSCHNLRQDLLTKQITSIRTNLYNTLTSRRFIEQYPIIQDMIPLDETVFKKCMMIMMHIGLDHKIIADLLCINKTFSALSGENILKVYPEIFK